MEIPDKNKDENVKKDLTNKQSMDNSDKIIDETK
jgi:hypothetical protein